LVLEPRAGRCLQQPIDILGAQQARQPARVMHPSKPGDEVGTSERDLEKEA